MRATVLVAITILGSGAALAIYRLASTWGVAMAAIS